MLANNQLPFLDTLVSLNKESNKFSTELFIKPIHSQLITPWDSHGSMASKRAILIGEARRAIACSTDKQSRTRSLRKITSLFVRNGYPKRFVRKVIRQTLHSPINTKDEDHSTIYLKLPYVNKTKSIVLYSKLGN